jgi:hypothetical protein
MSGREFRKARPPARFETDLVRKDPEGHVLSLSRSDGRMRCCLSCYGRIGSSPHCPAHVLRPAAIAARVSSSLHRPIRSCGRLDEEIRLWQSRACRSLGTIVTATPQQIPSSRGDVGPSVRAQHDFLRVFRDLRSDNSRLVVRQAAKAHKAGVDVLEQLRGLGTSLEQNPQFMRRFSATSRCKGNRIIRVY